MHMFFRVILTLTGTALLAGCLATTSTGREIDRAIGDVIRETGRQPTQRTTPPPVIRDTGDVLTSVWGVDAVWQSMDLHDRGMALKNLHENLERSDYGPYLTNWNSSRGRTYWAESRTWEGSGWTELCKYYTLRITLAQHGRTQPGERNGTACWSPYTRQWEYAKPK